MYRGDYDERYPINGGHLARSQSPIEVPLDYWVRAIYPYVKNAQIYECPSDGSPNSSTAHGQSVAVSYGYNQAFPGDGYSSYNGDRINVGTTPWTWDVAKDADLTNAVNTWVLADCYQMSVFTLTYLRATVGHNPWYSTPSGPEHNQGLNFSFADGHAKWLQARMFVHSYSAPQCIWRVK